MSIPNILTGIRFALIPIFAYYLYTEQYLTAIILFLLSGITDVLDGYIARKFNMITSWGKLADPIADKLMQITALVLLTIKGMIPVIIIVIVILKEGFMGIGSILLYKTKKYIVSANWYGKMATVIFFIAIIVIILFNLSQLYRDIFIGIAVISTLFAFFMYLSAYRKITSGSE